MKAKLIIAFFIFAYASLCMASDKAVEPQKNQSESGICDAAGRYAAIAFKEKANEIKKDDAVLSIMTIISTDKTYQELADNEKESFKKFIDGLYSNVYSSEIKTLDAVVASEIARCNDISAKSKLKIDEKQAACNAMAGVIDGIRKMKENGASAPFIKEWFKGVELENGEKGSIEEKTIDDIYATNIDDKKIKEIYLECIAK